MNTVNELLSDTINHYTATNMIRAFTNLIGRTHGDYIITDITYNPETRHKDFEFTCRFCGDIVHGDVKPGRRWNALRKRCSCTKGGKQKSIEKERNALIKSRVGKVFGDYKIISLEHIDGKPIYAMSCIVCGNEKTVCAWSFGQLNFECREHRKKKIKFNESYVGRKNNMLTVLDIQHDPEKGTLFKCLCDCGSIKSVKPTFWENGAIKSCGCLAASLKLEHSEEVDRLRRIHAGMVQRCYNPNSHAYKNYGGRGISICDEWKSDREAFIEWALSHGYANDLSIDRINNDGNYEPDNCRWADSKTQANNMRRENIKPPRRSKGTWTINGVTKPMTDWCSDYGVSYSTVMYRVNHKNMSIEDALTTYELPCGRPRKSL